MEILNDPNAEIYDMNTKRIVTTFQVYPKMISEQYADIEPFATLQNRKLLMPAENSQFFLMERHFASQLLENKISTIHVDERWYEEKYPDLAEAFTQGTISSAKEHYVKYGFYEGRMPYQILVNERWYLSQYHDVQAAIHRRNFISGQEHFDLDGYREGRLPFARFLLSRAK